RRSSTGRGTASPRPADRTCWTGAKPPTSTGTTTPRSPRRSPPRPRRFPPEPRSCCGMANDLARLQFGSTIIYHFLFVPVTIGLAFLVAILQTVWYRTDNPDYKRMTRFFGTLLLINVAIGVITGLVQEFQFGMNWSTYSRFVGGVFGAPLAMEGILAFFL